MSQRFIAREKYEFANGAIGWRPGGSYAKVQNCPVEGLSKRYTCYASNHADTFFSIPANTRINGRTIHGFFTTEDGNCVFHPLHSELEKIIF